MVNNLWHGNPICVKDKIKKKFLNLTLRPEMRCIFLWWTVFLHSLAFLIQILLIGSKRFWMKFFVWIYFACESCFFHIRSEKFDKKFPVRKAKLK